MPWIKHGPDHVCRKPKIMSDWLFWSTYLASEGDVWECDECNLRYTVLYNVFAGLYWSEGKLARPRPIARPANAGRLQPPPPARKGR